MVAPQTHAKQPSNLRLRQFECSVQTMGQWNVDKLELKQKLFGLVHDLDHGCSLEIEYKLTHSTTDLSSTKI